MTPQNEADRLKALKDMANDFPDVPKHLHEYVYNFVINHPERVERIMSGEEAIPPPKERSNVYTCNACTIEDYIN